MKAYIDIEQSKKLAEILPIESADFHFSANLSPKGYLEKPIWGNSEYADYSAFPCWSLAALLDILPETIEDEFAEYELQIDMTYKKPEYVRLCDCHHSDFPSWEWDKKELLDNIVEAVIWLARQYKKILKKIHPKKKKWQEEQPKQKVGRDTAD